MPRAIQLPSGHWQCTCCESRHVLRYRAETCCYEITAMWYRLEWPGAPGWFFKLRGRALEAGRQYGLKVYRVTRYRVRK